MEARRSRTSLRSSTFAMPTPDRRAGPRIKQSVYVQAVGFQGGAKFVLVDGDGAALGGEGAGEGGGGGEATPRAKKGGLPGAPPGGRAAEKSGSTPPYPSPPTKSTRGSSWLFAKALVAWRRLMPRRADW